MKFGKIWGTCEVPRQIFEVSDVHITAPLPTAVLSFQECGTDLPGIKRDLIPKMTHNIHLFMENTDDKYISIRKLSIKNQMVPSPKSVQILRNVTV